jgi:hypothetical protein
MFNQISTIFQLHRERQFYCRRRLEYPVKTIVMAQDTGQLDHKVMSSTPYHEQESFIIYSCVTGQHKLVYTVETLCIKVEWTNAIISNYPSIEFELSRLYYTNKFHKQP